MASHDLTRAYCSLSPNPNNLPLAQARTCVRTLNLTQVRERVAGTDIGALEQCEQSSRSKMRSSRANSSTTCGAAPRSKPTGGWGAVCRGLNAVKVSNKHTAVEGETYQVSTSGGQTPEEEAVRAEAS